MSDEEKSTDTLDKETILKCIEEIAEALNPFFTSKILPNNIKIVLQRKFKNLRNNIMEIYKDLFEE